MANDWRQSRRDEYAQRLRDPRWQRMRLQIMERDGWHCCRCGDAESTLNVHHLYYIQGADPWDYPADALVTLCESCHEIETLNRSESEQHLLQCLRTRGYLSADVFMLGDAVMKAVPAASLDMPEGARWAKLFVIATVFGDIFGDRERAQRAVDDFFGRAPADADGGAEAAAKEITE